MALTTREHKLSVLDWDEYGVAEGVTTQGNKQYLVNSPSIPLWAPTPKASFDPNARLNLAIGLGL